MKRSFRPFVLLAACAAVALLMAACGSDKDSSSSTTAPAAASTVDKDLAALVPTDIASKGVLSVGSDTTYAPAEFLKEDNATAQGFDVDLIKAVAGVLGLKANVQTSDFSAIIPGITSSKKFDIGVSSFTINTDRLKEVDMIEYFSAGSLWAEASNGKVDKTDVCGKAIAVQTDTVQDEEITASSTKCTDAGKEAIQIDRFTGQDDATQAVVSGKDVAMLADSPVIAYAVKQLNGKLKPLGDIYDSAPYGYAIAKDNGKFGEALQGAVKKLIDNGEYAKILKKWGVGAGAITADDVQINPSVS